MKIAMNLSLVETGKWKRILSAMVNHTTYDDGDNVQGRKNSFKNFCWEGDDFVNDFVSTDD
jgi:hypothetical protein